MLKTSTASPLGGDDKDSGALTINAEKCRRRAVNLHGHDRQKVILLTGPTSLRLVLLWLMILSRFTGMGNSVRHYLGYDYGLVQGHVSSGGKVHTLRV
jgi:hypothetical protein